MKGMWHSTNDHQCVGLVYQGINHEKAFKYFKDAAKRGWVDASYQVARYWKDRGDYKKTMESYKTAAHRGHVLANYKMARILLRGQLNQKVNIKQGLEYLKSAADAESDESAQAAYDLSCVYSDDLESIGMERDCLASRKNVSMAMYYLCKAQRSGFIEAYYQLGKVYEQGLLDQPRDVAKAFEHYNKAAEEDHDQAMLALSRFYYHGIPDIGLMPHYALAFKWCQRSAKKGLPQAEYVLGTYYEHGVGVDADYALALEWFSKAASKGYEPAAEQLNLPQKTLIKNPKKAHTQTSSVECIIM
ncbi:hypothetical protein BJ944DRAFT_185433 [Cunninghamella echinulata]|nr:hypothetical protein BJ944DRAFT_185433 [Cunninghamella echinulata]